MSNSGVQSTKGRRRIVVIALIAAVAMFAAALAVRSCSSNSDLNAGSSAAPTSVPGTPSVSPSAAASSPSASSTSEASICGLKDVQMSGNGKPVPEVDWHFVGDVLVPIKKGQGPGVIVPKGLSSCYARTPLGAVLAAANIYAQGSVRPQEVAEKLTVPGPGRDQALIQPVKDNFVPIGAVRGFRVLNYDGNTAEIDSLFYASTPYKPTAQVMTLQWYEGDWKVVLADDGSLPAKRRSFTQDPTGFYEWPWD